MHTYNGQNSMGGIVRWWGGLLSHYAMGAQSGSLEHQVFTQLIYQGFPWLSVWQILQGGSSTVAGTMGNPHTFISTSDRGWLWWEDSGKVLAFLNYPGHYCDLSVFVHTQIHTEGCFFCVAVLGDKTYWEQFDPSGWRSHEGIHAISPNELILMGLG